MGDFNHGHIQWTIIQSTRREDQEFLNLVQDSFLSQHVLEPTRGKNVLDIALSSQKEFVDNVMICGHWGVVITTRYILSSKYRENGREK